MATEIRPILSFTSTASRLPLNDEIFRAHVELAEACGLDICFSCADEAIGAMTDYQKQLVESGRIELLHIPKDHGSNTKWTLCRQNHPKAVMIVVDDDWIYDLEGIRSLLETSRRYPEAVICRAFRTIPWIGKELPRYEVKPFYTYPKTVTAHLRVNRLKDNVSGEEMIIPPGTAFPEHFLGMLYPPGFPKCSPSEIPAECMKDDDVFTGAMVAKEGRPLVFAGRDTIALDREVELPNALWTESRRTNGARTFKALQSVSSLFRERVEDEGLGQVFLLTCRKFPRRRESIKEEMTRLGITYIEQYDDGSICPDIGYRHKKLNRCHLAKHLALSRFLEGEGTRVTILEDDIRFLKDIGEVSKVIRTIPLDFGACRVSWIPSPYLRQEAEESNPERVAEVEMRLSKEGSFWVECPWASTDGCTIMTREVAARFNDLLKKVIEDNSAERMDNSDDMLCRVCEEMGKPLYVYKPLICIQTVQDDVEKGKSNVNNFLTSDRYRVKGVVRAKEEFFGIKDPLSRDDSVNEFPGYRRIVAETKKEYPIKNGRLISRGFVSMVGVRQRDDGDWW